MPKRRPRRQHAPFKSFDVTTKQIVEADPLAWMEMLGLPPAEVQVIDADLSTLAPEADKVLRVNAPKPYLLHIEFQSGYEPDLPERALFYNVVARRRHDVPVRTAVLLLRPEADGPAMSGRLEEEAIAGEEAFALHFGYRVVRVWEQEVERLLEGRLATLPLAPLTGEASGRLPEVIARMRARIEREAPARLQTELWATTFLLMGLRYEAALIERLLEGVMDMEESTTYQLLLSRGREQGRVEEARTLLLRIGRSRFGEPDAAVRAALTSASQERLEQMADRLLLVESWAELLA
jgi:predicted transposase YdaD